MFILIYMTGSIRIAPEAPVRYIFIENQPFELVKSQNVSILQYV